MTRWLSELARHPPAIEISLPAPLRFLADGAQRAARALLDLFLPPRCVASDAPVSAPSLLCAECFRRTGFITEPFCDRCGVPFAASGLGGTHLLCPGCRAAPPVFRHARAALRYDAQGRRLILPFKHADRTEIASALAPHMARAGAALLREADILVPVPLHRARLFHRRYNQAGLLAQAVGRIAGRPYLLDGLQRRRATTSLGKNRRRSARLRWRARSWCDRHGRAEWRASGCC
jgi:predicted amidophosphoribosyltransferase